MTARRLVVSICAEDLRVLMEERAVSTWEQFRLSQNCDGMAFHASLDAIRFISPAAFVFAPLLTLPYFSGAVQDHDDEPGDITPCHLFCAGAWMKMALRVMEGLAAELATRMRIPLLIHPVLVVFHALDQTVISTSHLAQIVFEVLGRQCAHHSLPFGNRLINIDTFRGDPTVWIHENAPLQPGSSFLIYPQISLRPTS